MPKAVVVASVAVPVARVRRHTTIVESLRTIVASLRMTLRVTVSTRIVARVRERPNVVQLEVGFFVVPSLDVPGRHHYGLAGAVMAGRQHLLHVFVGRLDNVGERALGEGIGGDARGGVMRRNDKSRGAKEVDLHGGNRLGGLEGKHGATRVGENGNKANPDEVLPLKEVVDVMFVAHRAPVRGVRLAGDDERNRLVVLVAGGVGASRNDANHGVALGGGAEGDAFEEVDEGVGDDEFASRSSPAPTTRSPAAAARSGGARRPRRQRFGKALDVLEGGVGNGAEFADNVGVFRDVVVRMRGEGFAYKLEDLDVAESGKRGVFRFLHGDGLTAGLLYSAEVMREADGGVDGKDGGGVEDGFEVHEGVLVGSERGSGLLGGGNGIRAKEERGNGVEDLRVVSGTQRRWLVHKKDLNRSCKYAARLSACSLHSILPLSQRRPARRCHRPPYRGRRRRNPTRRSCGSNVPQATRAWG